MSFGHLTVIFEEFAHFDFAQSRLTIVASSWMLLNVSANVSAAICVICAKWLLGMPSSGIRMLK